MEGGGGRSDAVVAIVGYIKTIAGIVGYGLVTSFTPRETYLQVVEPVFLQVLRKAITESCCRECTIAVVASEA